MKTIATLAALLFASIVQAEVVWQSDPAAALALAQREGKMVFVHFRSAACEECNVTADKTFAKLEKDEVFTRALDAYVPLRVKGPYKTPIAIDGVKLRRGAAVVMYDATGVRLAGLDNNALGAPEKIVETMLRVRNVRQLVTKSVTHRLAGESAAADFTLGHALMPIQAWSAARERFQSAADAYAASGDRQSQQFAQVGVATAMYGENFRVDARERVQEILRDPVTTLIAAEAHYRLGTMLETDAVGSIPTPTNARADALGGVPTQPTTRGSRPGVGRTTRSPIVSQRAQQLRGKQWLEQAVESYRKAYELALPDSPTFMNARMALARLDPRPLPDRGTATASLRVIPPAQQGITGISQFRAEGSANLARVDFFLDEKPVASAKQAPFAANIDVGKIARARVVKARGFDRGGNPVGEAVVTINDRADAFAVTIVAPVADSVAGRQTAEVDVRVPPGRKLSKVEFSWNGEPFATMSEGPLRAPFTAGNDLGYLRAVATLDDGATTEATRVYNAVVAESVEVGAVTVLATVLDKRNEPIRGLRASDFLVHDEKQPVAITLRAADDEPVTIGIAVDASSSMTGRQLYVIRAAAEFLSRALRPQDSGFVVAFSHAAWVAHSRSTDAKSLRESVLNLTPAGGTSIYDGLTLALQQFQGLAGKKALLVFSDGREGKSRATLADASRLASAVGVPIYVVVPPGGLKEQHALRRISEATGGVMLYAVPLEEFADMADGLADEVRSQYVLSFTRPSGVQSGAWRTIRVRVRDREDAVVRTMQGYRAN